MFLLLFFFPDRQLTVGGFAKILLHASIKTVRSNYLVAVDTPHCTQKGGECSPWGSPGAALTGGASVILTLKLCIIYFWLPARVPCTIFLLGREPYQLWQASKPQVCGLSSNNSHPKKCPIASMVHSALLKSPSFCSPWGVRPTRDWGAKPLFPPLSTQVLLYLLVPLILVLRTPQGSRAVASTE